MKIQSKYRPFTLGKGDSDWIKRGKFIRVITSEQSLPSNGINVPATKEQTANENFPIFV